MGYSAEAWFLYPHDGKRDTRRAVLQRETFELPSPEANEVIAKPLFGSWEGNMTHALERRPVDVCKQRREPRVVLGNSGVVRVVEVGSEVTTVKAGQIAILFIASVVDEFGYPELILGYDAPNTMGCLSTMIKCRGHELVPIPEGSGYPLPRWAALSLRSITAWSNWELAYGTFRLLVGEDEMPAPNVWAWGGGTALAAVDLARRAGCRTVMLSSSPQRLSLIESTGVAALDRRPFGDLNFDERKLASDPEYRQRYMQAEEKFLAEVARRTDGKGVQIFIDNIGTPVFRATLKALSREGVIATVGWKQGMVINYLRAAECIGRHQFVHTHYARYPQGEAAVAYAEENGWLPIVDERIFTFDEIPELVEAYYEGNVGMYPIYQVNPD